MEFANISQLKEYIDLKISRNDGKITPEEHNIIENGLATFIQQLIDGKQNVLGYIPESVANRGIANGYAPLDTNRLVPVELVDAYTKATADGRFASKDHYHNHSDILDWLDAFLASLAEQKGIANGVAPLDGNATVPAVFLPSYVDDVLEFANLAAFPNLGETGKIYIALDTNAQYRWSGSTYIKLVASPGTTDDVPEGAINKYYTNQRVQNFADGRYVSLYDLQEVYGQKFFIDGGFFGTTEDGVSIVNGNITGNNQYGSYGIYAPTEVLPVRFLFGSSVLQPISKNLTGNRNWYLPDASGTIALKSELDKKMDGYIYHTSDSIQVYYQPAVNGLDHLYENRDFGSAIVFKKESSALNLSFYPNFWGGLQDWAYSSGYATYYLTITNSQVTDGLPQRLKVGKFNLMADAMGQREINITVLKQTQMGAGSPAYPGAWVKLSSIGQDHSGEYAKTISSTVDLNRGDGSPMPPEEAIFRLDIEINITPVDAGNIPNNVCGIDTLLTTASLII